MGILQIDNQQKGLRFDGVNDYVSIPNLSLNTNYANSFSVVIDFNIVVTGTTRSMLFATTNQSSDTIGLYVMNFPDFNSIGIVLYKSGTVGLFWSVPYIILSNVTYNFAVSYSNGICNMYINNVLYSNNNNGITFGGYVTSDNTTSNTIYTILSRIGHGPLYTNGICFDFKLFNRAISGSEVSTLYNKGTVDSGCLINYSFTNRSGTTVTNNIGGNDGTLINYTAGDTTIGSSNKWLYNYSREPFDNSRKSGVLQINNN